MERTNGKEKMSKKSGNLNCIFVSYMFTHINIK